MTLKPRLSNDIFPALVFLAPNFVGFIVFAASPVLFSLVASFTNWDLQHTVPFAFTGATNYRALSHDREFWTYLINTIYLMLGLPFAIAGALGLALLLNQKLRGIGVYRALFYIPSFVSGVAVMLLWKKLYNPDYGPINAVLRAFIELLHIPATPPAWLSSPNNVLGLATEGFSFTSRFWGLGARDALVLMSVWMLIGGNNMLLYLAALTNVPQDLYDAADIDGASGWQKFWNVTWPQLAPTTFFIVVINTIYGLQSGFESARIMTEGGPAGTTTTLAYYIYIKAFLEFQMGYASAIAWILFAMIFAITLVQWRFGSRAINE